MSQFIDGRGWFERPSIPQPAYLFTSLPAEFDPAPVIPAVYQQAGSFRAEQEVLDGVLNYLDQPTHVGIFQDVLNFFEAPYFVPSRDQTHSFRSDEEAKEGVLLLQDQPVQAGVWHEFLTALYAAVRDQGHSFRSDDEDKEGVLRFLDQLQDTPLWREALGFWDVAHYAATTAQQSTEVVGTLDESIYWLNDQPNVDWIFENLTEFDASIFQPSFDLQTQSFRAEGEELEKQSFIQSVAEWKPVLNYWDAFFFPPIHDFAQSFRAGDEETDRTLHEYQPPAPAIWQEVLNLWDVQHYAGTNDQTRSFRSDDEHTDRHLILNEGQPQAPSIWQDVLNFWEAPLYVSIHDQSKSHRSFERIEDEFFHVQEPPQPGWIFTSLPTYDVSFQPGINFQTGSFRFDKQVPDSVNQLLDQPVTVGYWPLNFFEAPFYVSIYNQSQSYMSFDRIEDEFFRVQEPVPPSWIFPSLPVGAGTVGTEGSVGAVRRWPGISTGIQGGPGVYP